MQMISMLFLFSKIHKEFVKSLFTQKNVLLKSSFYYALFAENLISTFMKKFFEMSGRLL